MKCRLLTLILGMVLSAGCKTSSVVGRVETGMSSVSCLDILDQANARYRKCDVGWAYEYKQGRHYYLYDLADGTGLEISTVDRLDGEEIVSELKLGEKSMRCTWPDQRHRVVQGLDIYKAPSPKPTEEMTWCFRFQSSEQVSNAWQTITARWPSKVAMLHGPREHEWGIAVSTRYETLCRIEAYVGDLGGKKDR